MVEKIHQAPVKSRFEVPDQQCQQWPIQRVGSASTGLGLTTTTAAAATATAPRNQRRVGSRQGVAITGLTWDPSTALISAWLRSSLGPFDVCAVIGLAGFVFMVHILVLQSLTPCLRGRGWCRKGRRQVQFRSACCCPMDRRRRLPQAAGRRLDCHRRRECQWLLLRSVSR